MPVDLAIPRARKAALRSSIRVCKRMRLSSAARQRAIVNGALREPGEITASRTPERMSWSTITSPKTGDGVNDINAHLP